MVIPIKSLLSRVTRQFEGQTPNEINCGSCQEWAEMVYEFVENYYQVELWETVFGLCDTSHFFIKIEGNFYDAECLDGVDNHMQLPIFSKFTKLQPVICLDANCVVLNSFIGCSKEQLEECGYTCK